MVARRGLERMIDCNEGLKPSVPFELHLLLFNPIYFGGSVTEAVKRVVLFPTGPLRTHILDRSTRAFFIIDGGGLKAEEAPVLTEMAKLCC